MLLSIVDVIFADVAQPDQARIVALNADYFLKNEGYAVISIKANCIDSTMPAEQVFANEVQLLKTMKFKPTEQLTLEPYERVSCIPFPYNFHCPHTNVRTTQLFVLGTFETSEKDSGSVLLSYLHSCPHTLFLYSVANLILSLPHRAKQIIRT